MTTVSSGVNDVSIVADLRRSTRVEHERLERELDLLSPTLTRERYGSVIAAFLGIYKPIEAKLKTALGSHLYQQLGGSDRARKTLWLESDLRGLGIKDRKSVGECSVDTGTTARTLGVLYVVEGATLGAQVIRPHLTSLGFGPETTRFFYSYGNGVSPMWATMREVLKEQLVTVDQRTDAINGASAMFAAIFAQLQRTNALNLSVHI